MANTDAHSHVEYREYLYNSYHLLTVHYLFFSISQFRISITISHNPTVLITGKVYLYAYLRRHKIHTHTIALTKLEIYVT